LNKHNTNFKTQVFTCTFEINYGRGNRTLKHKRLSPTPYRFRVQGRRQKNFQVGGGNGKEDRKIATKKTEKIAHLSLFWGRGANGKKTEKIAKKD